uniref:Uncharacterized protein n=1 Tax=Heterorhabditis bacteriophora TaxID=37862 RepID=A0A1I7W5X9_HETBA
MKSHWHVEKEIFWCDAVSFFVTSIQQLFQFLEEEWERINVYVLESLSSNS